MESRGWLRFESVDPLLTAAGLIGSRSNDLWVAYAINLLEPPEKVDYLADEVNEEELSNEEHRPRLPS